MFEIFKFVFGDVEFVQCEECFCGFYCFDCLCLWYCQFDGSMGWEISWELFVCYDVVCVLFYDLQCDCVVFIE